MAIRRTITILSLSIAVACAVTACSEEARYRTLRFFFDGVPKPGAPPPPKGYAVDPTVFEFVSPDSEPVVKRIARVLSSHAPFRNNQCGDCHNARTGGAVRTAQEGLCRTCHRDIPGPTRHVHGPVAVSDCCVCHHYHSSVHPKLLLNKSSELCLRCHRSADLTEGRYHPVARQQTCIECHDPHGADNPYYLKPPESWGQYVHGPVAVDDCDFCHRYHAPRDTEPLLSDSAALCFRCHRRMDLTEGPHHAAIGERDCVECHDPHGGNDPYFLKRAKP